MENYGTPQLVRYLEFCSRLGNLEHKREVVNTGQRHDHILMLYMHQNTKKNYSM